MNIFVIYSANEKFPFFGNTFKKAHLSYAARGNVLMSEKNVESDGGVMIVSMDNADSHIAASIYDEYRARRFSGVFLDSDLTPSGKSAEIMSETVSALSRRTEKIFVPLAFAEACRDAVPVAAADISGGVLSEYLEMLLREHKRLALAVPRTVSRFKMPAENPTGERLSLSEFRSLCERFGAGGFFSPQMIVNYFTYPTPDDGCGFVLFDDAKTITEKVRLAMRLGIEDVFLTLREIADIADDISL